MLMEGCSLIGSISLLIVKPMVARLMQEAILMTKSGAARRLGLMVPSPPLLTLSRLIRVDSGGRCSFCGNCRSCWRKVSVILSIPEVSGPAQLYHCSKSDSLSVG